MVCPPRQVTFVGHQEAVSNLPNVTLYICSVHPGSDTHVSSRRRYPVFHVTHVPPPPPPAGDICAATEGEAACEAGPRGAGLTAAPTEDMGRPASARSRLPVHLPQRPQLAAHVVPGEC